MNILVVSHRALTYYITCTRSSIQGCRTVVLEYLITAVQVQVLVLQYLSWLESDEGKLPVLVSYIDFVKLSVQLCGTWY
jgi:hypothetical protein